MCDIPEILGLVFVELDGLFVQGVFHSILLQLIIFVKSMQMFQCFGKPAQEVVNRKTTAELGQALQVSEEWKILSWILEEKNLLITSELCRCGHCLPFELAGLPKR